MTTETSNSVKYYIHTKDNKWVISETNDPGIIQLMTNLKVQLQTQINAKNEKKSYWFLSNETFNNIKHTLDASGYTLFVPMPKEPTAAFKVQSASKTQPDIKALQEFNPIKYPAVAQRNPKAASEFAQNHTYSISEFTKQFKASISAIFPLMIWVQGEVTDFRSNKGNVYLTLVEHIDNGTEKGDNYALDAAIWKNTFNSFLARIQAGSLPQIKNGEKIRVCGVIDFYPPSGKLSFIIKDIDDTFAEGEFIKQKERVWNELKKLNLHENNLHLPMPMLPLRLAIFTGVQTQNSDEAAGWGDFNKIVSASGFPFQITTFPVAVQGINVEPSFLKAFDALEIIGTHNFDLAIILRGGGSTPDFACFNNLNIARRVAMMPLKFIIAIGHEKDRCVLDEIAMRTATPSEAAEKLCKICTELVVSLGKYRDSVSNLALNRMTEEKHRVSQLASSCAALALKKKSSAETQLLNLKSNLNQTAQNRLSDYKSNIQQLTSELKFAGTQTCNNAKNQLIALQTTASVNAHAFCNMHLQKLMLMHSALGNSAHNRIHAEHALLGQISSLVIERTKAAKEKQNTELENLKFRLDALNPESILKRGFVMISDKDGNRISSVQDVTKKDKIHIRMIDGKITATVSDVLPDTDNT